MRLPLNAFVFQRPRVSPFSGPAASWDGCNHAYLGGADDDGADDIEAEGTLLPVDVEGFGLVPQVWQITDSRQDAGELYCRQTPMPRAHHVGAYFQQRVWLLGGQQRGANDLQEDVWYRDPFIPRTFLMEYPAHGSSETLFKFESDKAGCIFEWRVFALSLKKGGGQILIKDWSPAFGRVNVGFLKDNTDVGEEPARRRNPGTNKPGPGQEWPSPGERKVWPNNGRGRGRYIFYSRRACGYLACPTRRYRRFRILTIPPAGR